MSRGMTRVMVLDGRDDGPVIMISSQDGGWRTVGALKFSISSKIKSFSSF